MGEYSPYRIPRSICGLVLATMMLLSVMLIAPDVVRRTAALTPGFSRPNILVDAGPGGIGATIGGGPAVAVGLGGALHAVWSDSRSGTDRGIYYARSTDNGATWALETRIDGAIGYDNVAPSIMVDMTGSPYGGSIYVVWQKGVGTNADILFIKSIDGGLSWINRYRIDSAPVGVGSSSPQVVVDGAGTIYIAFADGRNGNEEIYLSRSDTGGLGWSDEKILSASPDFDGNPTLSASGPTVAVAWEERNSSNAKLLIAASSDKGINWQTNTIVSRDISMGDVYWVSLALDDAGRFHASWTALDQFGTYSTVYSQSTDSGATWAYPIQVNDNLPLPAYNPHSSSVLATTSALYIVWVDNRNGDYDVFASWSENGGVTWGDGIPADDIRVDDTDDNAVTTDDSTMQTSPSAAASQFGIYVIWADDRDNVAVHAYFAAFDAGALIVTEIRDSPDGMERIELFNRGASAVDVTGWLLDIDGISQFISALGSIPSLQYRTVGDEATSDLVVDITLNDEGGSIRLFDQTGTLMELAAYGQNGMVPDPLTSESVSRVFRNGVYSRYWTRSQIPTFRAQNTGPVPNTDSSIIINEVFYNASDSAKRFIEILNRGSTALNVTGDILIGDAMYVIPSANLDALNSYLLVFPSQAPALFSTIDATGDNLYLYDSAGTLLDMVGWTTTHTQDRSMCRVPEGFGFSEGFDDVSSMNNGWMFDCDPSPHLIGVGPPSTVFANMGDTIYHEVFVMNSMDVPTTVDLSWNPPPSGWDVALLASDHVTPLQDTNSNSWPDVSLDRFGSVNQTVNVALRVSMPPSTPLNESITTHVVAQAQPEGRDSVDLATGFYPYLSVDRKANPTTVYVRGTGYGEESTTTLELAGRGMKIPGTGPDAADVVFVIDDTGSMGSWIDAVVSDVDRITNSLLANVSDMRFGLVSFKDVPDIDIDQDLTQDIALFKTALFALAASGGADTPEDPDIALELAANLSWRFGATPKVMILVSDAQAHNNVHLAMVARWAYNVLNIHTNAIGCGNDINMINAFTATALEGHGYFLQLGNPSSMADAIIRGIMAVLPAIDYAAQDRDLNDGNPMVRDVLPPYIAYVPGTFLDPQTSTPRPPAFVGTDGSGNTILEWNVSQLKINKTWSVQFNITSSLTGFVPTNVLGLSRVSFVNWSGANITLDFPEAWITVLATPPLPDLALSPSDIVPFPPTPYLEGHLLYLNATIRNLGRNASGTAAVRFHDGIPPAPTIGGDQTLPGIPVSGTGVVSAAWIPMVVGVHDICVIVDPANVVREENETNNEACLNIVVQPTKPDYIPYSPQPPSDFKVGVSLVANLSIMVFNQGNRTAAYDSTLIFRNQSAPGFAQFTVPAVAANGTSAPYTVQWLSPSIAGTYQVSAVVDYFGNISEWDESNNVFTWNIQVVNSPITSLVIGSPNHIASQAFITSNTPLYLTVDDRSGTGIRRTMYSVNYGAWTALAPGGKFNLTPEGEHNVRWYSEDFTGNTEVVNSRMVVVDDTPPTSVLAIGDPKYSGTKTWVTSLATISLSALDGGALPVGLGPTFYRIRNGSWSPWSSYISPFRLVGKDGLRRIEFYSEDLLGNGENLQSVQIFVDNTPPTMTLEPFGSSFAIGTEFSLTADDGTGSGVSSTWVSLDGSTFVIYTRPFSFGLGQHRIVHKSVDRLGNPAEHSRLINVVTVETQSPSTSFNYKPTVAFVFSIILLLTAALSARKRPLRYGKSLRRRFASSLAVLPLPFLIAEAVTGALSVPYELLRIPPLVGWGTFIDSLVLTLGMLFLTLRFLIKRKGKKGRGNEAEREGSLPPPTD